MAEETPKNPGRNQSKTVNVNLSLGEASILSEIKGLMTEMSKAVTLLAGASGEMRGVIENDRKTRHRRGADRIEREDGSTDFSGGRNFIPFSSVKDVFSSNQDAGELAMMQRGLQMPRFGQWNVQDYATHAGIVAGHIGRKHVIDERTGQIDYAVKMAGQDGLIGMNAFMSQARESPEDEQYYHDTEKGEIFSNKTPGYGDRFDTDGSLKPEHEGKYKHLGRDMAGIRAAGMLTAQRGASGFMGGLSDAAFGVARIAPIASTAIITAKKVMGFIGGQGRANQQLGYDRTSMAGYSESASSKLSEMWSSGFGFNPFFSGGDAEAAMGAIHGLGYRGGERSKMFGMTTDLVANKGLDAKTTVEQIDRAFRSGSSSINDFRSVLMKIPAAAEAATMSVKDMQKALGSIADNIANTQGIGYASAFNQASALTTATGMTPEMTNNIMGNKWLTVLGANRAGQTVGQYLTSGNEATGNMGSVETAFRAAFGGELKNLINDPTMQSNVATMLFSMGGKWQGMTMDDLNKLSAQMGDPNTMKNVGAESQLQHLTSISVGDKTFAAGMGDITGGAGRVAYNKRLLGVVESSGIDQKEKTRLTNMLTQNNGLGDKGRSTAGEYEEINKAIGEYARKSAHDAQTTASVSLEFKGNTGDILKAVIDGERGNAKYGNTQTLADTADQSRLMGGAARGK
jgi:hypothetical protein